LYGGKLELEAIQTINTDVLVIGGGAAGLRAAIAARKHGVNVVLTSESPVGFGNNTAISRAALAATGIWKEPGDSPEVHFNDMNVSGRFINDQRLVATMTRAARQQVYDLMEFGVNFRRRNGELLVGRTPGHTYPRHVVAEENKGINITRPMRQYTASIGVQFLEGMLVTKLLRSSDMVVGVIGLDDKGRVFVVNAKSTVLATGGAGRIYLRTNNAIGSTGDGYALAYEVGAVLRDMEFVQFYPTAWGKQGSKMCMYERFLPMGATVRNSVGEDILKRYGIDDTASVTRDILARVIMREIIDGRDVEGNVIFDFTTIPEDNARRLYLSGLMRKEGNPDRLLVGPTVHFFMGGIVINEGAEAGVDGLYAAGEVCGGLHGANRLGGNAICETLVFGNIAGNQAARAAAKKEPTTVIWSEVAVEVERLRQLASGNGRKSLDELEQSLRQMMWDKVGVIRERRGLEVARQEILALRAELTAVSVTDHRCMFQAIKLANMLTVSEMICRSALIRTESRGSHYRTDYPEEDNGQWLKNIEICRRNGEMLLSAVTLKTEVD